MQLCFHVIKVGAERRVCPNNRGEHIGSPLPRKHDRYTVVGMVKDQGQTIEGKSILKIDKVLVPSPTVAFHCDAKPKQSIDRGIELCICIFGLTIP